MSKQTADFFIKEADPWRQDAWDIIRRTPHLTYQILTKRPDNILDHLPDDWGDGWTNVWLGVSVEDNDQVTNRVPELLEIPAKVRFLSCEPLLDEIDLSTPGILTNPSPEWIEKHKRQLKVDLDGVRYLPSGLGGIPVERYVHWVIIGGESGPNARPMSLDWARKIDFQCKQAGVPVFWKQLGAVQARALGLKDPKGGDPGEWPFEGRREFPESIPVTIPEPELIQASLF